MIGKDEYYEWDLSEKSDILNIRKHNKKVDGSAELGDFTIDFDKNGSIVGVEIMNISDFIKQIGLSIEQLRGMQHAEIVVNKRNPSMMVVFLKMKLPNVEQIVPLPVPILTPACS